MQRGYIGWPWLNALGTSPAEFHIHRNVASPRQIVDSGRSNVSSMKHVGAADAPAGGEADGPARQAADVMS